ncbi:hypothetical protein [Halocatena marina]|uniref:Metal-dependent hydrolase n=1 Tax=Halocatena marina TaxID=2934937 RepID=A0ABD5YMQ5_9EURY|nr:hypothetical protein [Halocatena marina]
MKSTEHAVVGAIVGAVGALALGERLSRPAKVVLWCYGVFLSVFIDLDHFLLARYLTGDWELLFEALSDPKRAFTAPAWLFEGLTMRTERLLSHTIIGGVLTLVTFVITPFLAVYTAVVLYAHLLCDLLRDTRVA